MLNSVNFNGRPLSELPGDVASMQRALYYGDALFESIRVIHNHAPLLPLHWDRLRRGMQTLGMEVPEAWTLPFWKQEMQKLTLDNHRLRLTVGRSPGGLYRPVENSTFFLMEAQPLHEGLFELPGHGLTLGYSEQVQLPVDRFSNLKSLNTARYVQAAREAATNGWDDALLMNSFNRICETTGSTLFWVEGRTVFTPPLTEGCVEGVVRTVLKDLLSTGTLLLLEKKCTADMLDNADEVFVTNAVRGIRSVLKIKEKQFNFDIIPTIHKLFIQYIEGQ